MIKQKRLKLAHRLELVGLILVLVAAGAQLFSQDLNDLVIQSEFFQLNRKVDLLWQLNREIAMRKLQVDDTVLRHLNDDTGRYIALENSSKAAQSQAEAALIIYASLYVIGSVSLIVGRYIKTTLGDNESQRA
jgi:hypothetical protein